MPSTRTNDVLAIARAAQMEHQILDHVKKALRVTLDWKAPSISLPRKMSSVQFTMKSFARHLCRMMDLEEWDGYMTVVLEVKPNLDGRIRRLQQDHQDFRAVLEELGPDIAALPVLDEEHFDHVCSQIAELVDRVDQHDDEEVALLMDTLLHDEGGEGG